MNILSRLWDALKKVIQGPEFMKAIKKNKEASKALDAVVKEVINQ